MQMKKPKLTEDPKTLVEYLKGFNVHFSLYWGIKHIVQHFLENIEYTVSNSRYNENWKPRGRFLLTQIIVLQNVYHVEQLIPLFTLC